MSEIVTRLRHEARDINDFNDDPSWSRLMQEAADEIERLQQDLARTVSAHAVVMAENKHYKQRVAVLEQCHREGWHYAREVEDEYERRTGDRFGAAQPPGDGQ